MTSLFTFMSPWALNPHGREDLLRAFKASEGGLEAKIIPEIFSAECISMRCTEQCFISFVQFASRFYYAELARESDTFEEPKLTRISGTSASGAYLTPKGIPARQCRVPAEIEKDELFKHETYMIRWKPTAQNEQGHIIFHFLPIMIGKIESATEVRIEGFSSKCDLTIFGDTEGSVSKASQKLDILEDALARQPSFHDYLVLEGEISVRLQMLPLKEVPDLRLKTTMISPQSTHYKSLPSSHVVVMVKDGEVCTVNPTARDGDSAHLWQGHELSVHSPKGFVQSTIRATPITRWVDESSAAPIVDPFVPMINADVDPEHSTSSTVPKPPPEKFSTKRARKLKGAADMSMPLDSGPQIKLSPVVAGLNERKTVGSNDESSGSASQSLVVKEDSHQVPMDIAPSKAKSEQPLAQLHINAQPTRQPPIIQPPFMPPPSTGASKSFEPSRHNWEDIVVAPSRNSAGILIDLDIPTASTQPTKAVKGRMHRTMDQKKPQIIASSNKLVEAFTIDILKMMCSVTARPGVQVEVSIGRMLVDRHTIPPEFRKKSFDVKEWPYVVSHLRTEFTGWLTTKSSDISNIISTKVQHGRTLFAKTPIQRNVLYIIDCMTRSNEHITIEVSENRQFAIRGARVLNGALNWHFAKRAWDARFMLTSQEFLGGDYLLEIQSIVNSIERSRSPDGTGFTISFQSRSPTFLVQSMSLRREIVHTPTMYPDLQLHLTEVQDLNVGQSADESDHYIGTIAPQDEMVANHRLWWQVSISSQHATNILKENETLELGEKARWKPEHITEHGMVEDMYAVAQEVVTRIDHVGIENMGPGKTGSKDTTRPSAKSYELPTGIPGFW